MTPNRTNLHQVLLSAVIFALNVLPVSGADVVLQRVTEPAGSVVRLGDVAKVKADDPQEVKRLVAIPLLPAPAPGQRRFIRMREIQDLLAAHGEELSRLDFSGELVVEIAPPAAAPAATNPNSDRRAVWAGTSAVSAASMTAVPESGAPESNAPRLTEAQAKEAQNYIERAVIEHLNRNSGRNADWKLAIQVSPADLAKVLEAKTSLQCSGGVAPWTGNQRLVVAFSTVRGPVRVRLEAIVTATQPVVVATGLIEKGQIITAADVSVQEWEQVPQETARRKLIDSLDTVIGMESTQLIQAGEAMFTDDYRPQILVKRGDELVVYARGGGIQVRTIARARQNGARGELIGVESLDEKQPFEAVVVGPREAVVFTGSDVAAKPKVADQPFPRLRKK
jgi:flagellar basal body P-ring formation protein FlgA